MRVKKVGLLLGTLALFGWPGFAQEAVDSWGMPGATPGVAEDSKGREGGWWWPRVTGSKAEDPPLWGNRGVVFRKRAETPEPEPVPPPPPHPDGGHPRGPFLPSVLFDFDSAELHEETKDAVGQVVGLMKKYPQDTVLIGGHTDSDGDGAYNHALGIRRAEAVKQYMVKQGIDAARITTKSFGEGQPAVPNDTRETRALNRRVMFKPTLGN